MIKKLKVKIFKKRSLKKQEQGAIEMLQNEFTHHKIRTRNKYKKGLL